METCHYSHEFLLTLQSCYLILMIDKPKRVHRTSASLIDNIFVNNPDQVVLTDNLIIDVSNHFLQFCILASTIDRIKQRQIKRDFSHFCSDTFNDELAMTDWNLIIERPGANIDETFISFYKTIDKIVNKHAPIITFSKRKIKQFSEPWLTKGLQISIQTKKTDYINPMILRNINFTETKLFCSLIHLSKKSCYHEFFKNNLNDMRKMWPSCKCVT